MPTTASAAGLRLVTGPAASPDLWIQEVSAMPQDRDRRITASHSCDADTLRRAVDAVDVAVRALRADPASPSVAQTVASAQVFVAALPAGFVATTMRRLLDTVEDCRRAGLDSCVRLTAQHSAAARAVRLTVLVRAG
jgi:hypothetical protein